jgi:hypothetical protein
MKWAWWADGPGKAGGPGGSPPAGGLGGSAPQAGRLGWHRSVGGGAVCAFFAQSAPFGWVEWRLERTVATE